MMGKVKLICIFLSNTSTTRDLVQQKILTFVWDLRIGMCEILRKLEGQFIKFLWFFNQISVYNLSWYLSKVFYVSKEMRKSNLLVDKSADHFYSLASWTFTFYSNLFIPFDYFCFHSKTVLLVLTNENSISFNKSIVCLLSLPW